VSECKKNSKTPFSDNLWGLEDGFFAFLKILYIFDPTNQIFLPFKGVWFLLRRAERLGSEKPWQPIPLNREKGAKT
jgi:hypothetical protein